jgi:hypothetical protein
MKKALLVIISFILLLSSCSKETVFSYYLKGNWTISELDVTETTDTITSSYTLHNAGTYAFNKNNEGSLTVSADTTIKTIAFKWSAESNANVLITFNDQSSEKWTVLSDKPETQIWENTTITTQSSGGVSATTTVYKKLFLKKFK